MREIAGHRPIDDRDALRGALLERLRAAVRDANVIGFGIAEKEVGERAAGAIGISFFVREKRGPSRLRAAQAIPELLSDPQGRAIYTDVVEVGDVVAQAAQVATDPIRSGYSIGHVRGAPGTLGAIVVKGGQPHLLSAQHVFADFDRAAPGDPILYPARGDGGTVGDAIGRLAAFSPLDRSSGFPNRVDAALARIEPAAFARIDRSVAGAVAPLQAAAAALDMPVRLSGRSSGDRQSVVRAIKAEVKIYQLDRYIGFSEQIACAAFSDGGDSGSLVIHAESGRAIGLLVGGSSRTSFVTPIGAVLAALGARFDP
ncbi:MAG TPA: hypothetical protein PKD99_02005 [Sphingopyxis sp.]|nr:hypothetical protein [Sphingopyxis sp.]HMP43851.1 hypothetical protein [Sphingopyxis sp.]HMQ19355.1 hypothetical protein [Sphingopyxis sp.]